MKTKSEYVTLAQSRGSTATTAKGALKWLLAHPVAPRKLTAQQWKLHETLDHCRVGDALQVPGERDGGRAYGYRMFALPSRAAENAAAQQMHANNPRKRPAYHGYTLIDGSAVSLRWETIHYKGKYKGYTGSAIYADYQSALAVANSKRTAVVIVGNVVKQRVRLPKHYRFGEHTIVRTGGLWTIPTTEESIRSLRADSIRSLPQLRAEAAKHGATVCRDANGLRLVIGPDDYHPSEYELRKWDVAGWVAKIQANAATRKRLAAEREAESADIAGVWVCLADSLRAGNCRAGTEQFAIRHGLDLRRHYRASQILAQANGDEGRVRLAIKAACIRTHIECERGYSLLSEHYV